MYRSTHNRIFVKSSINYLIDCRKHICAACRYMISLDLSCSRLSAAFLLRQKKMRFHTPSFSHHLSSLHNLLQQSAVQRSKVTREELILRFSFYRNLRKIWQLSSKFHRWDRKFCYHVLVHIDTHTHTYTHTRTHTNVLRSRYHSFLRDFILIQCTKNKVKLEIFSR